MQSEKIDLLAAALCSLQGELQDVEKNSANPFFKSKYADLSAVWNAVRPLLLKHGLSVAQIGIAERILGETSIGPTLVTTLLHKSGQWISGETPLLAKDASMQQLGSAWTYARRYGLSAILGVSQADDDGHEATHSQKKGQPAKVAANPQPLQSGQPESPGDWVIPFGTKYKGKKIRELSYVQFEDFAKYLEEGSQKEGKPLGKMAADFIQYGTLFFGATTEDIDY